MIENIRTISNQKLYWISLFILGLSLEIVALIYQHAFDEWPCVLCIHIRIWVMGFTLLSLIALVTGGSNQWTNRGLHLINSGMMFGFAERSWQTLAVERGWVFGDCAMESGLPAWFALDKWFPAMFEVMTACGYTPVIVFNITMAEMLLAISSLLFLLSLAMTFVSFCTKKESV